MKARRTVLSIVVVATVVLSATAGASPSSDSVQTASEASEIGDQSTAEQAAEPPHPLPEQPSPSVPSQEGSEGAQALPTPAEEQTPASGAPDDADLPDRAVDSETVETSALTAASSTDTLHAGESLSPGQSLTSLNGLFRLVVQDDGNVGIYGPSGVSWASMTSGPEGRVTVQSDGNAGFISAGRALLTNTSGTGDGNRLVIHDDGTLALRSVGGVLLWSAQGLGTGNSRDILGTGNSIYPGQFLVSRNGRYRLVVQADGNVGVFGPAGATWASMTPGAGARVTVQADGNVGFFSSTRILETRTGATGFGHQLVMQDDGNLVLSSLGGVPVWSSKFGVTGSTRDSLGTMTALVAGQALVSRNGRYRLVVQTDGNVGIYGPSGVTWASMTPGANGRVVVQSDGNVGALSSNRVWDSRTGGTGNGHRLTIQDDGNLVLDSAGGVSIWSLRWGHTGNTIDSLAVGSSLYPGHSLISRNGRYQTVVQGDGNVGVYGPGGRVLWESATPGGNARVTVQNDGNVGFFSSGRILATNTGGTGNGHRLQMQDDGNLALWANSGLPMWSTMGGRYAYANTPLFAYGTLRPGQSAWPRIAGFSIADRSASVAGFSMYYSANRSFPWAVPGGNGVHGDLVFLNSGSYQTAIATMDAYERYDPTLPAANQAYIRELRPTTTGIGAWMYVTTARQAAYVRGSLPLLASGDWVRR